MQLLSGVSVLPAHLWHTPKPHQLLPAARLSERRTHPHTEQGSAKLQSTLNLTVFLLELHDCLKERHLLFFNYEK